MRSTSRQSEALASPLVPRACGCHVAQGRGSKASDGASERRETAAVRDPRTWAYSGLIACEDHTTRATVVISLLQPADVEVHRTT